MEGCGIHPIFKWDDNIFDGITSSAQVITVNDQLKGLLNDLFQSFQTTMR